MNRRDFLKLSGAASIALLLQAGPAGKLLGAPTQAEAKGVLYRGTPHGKIYRSPDGKKWEQMVNFGPDYSIDRVDKDLRGQVFARLRYSGRAFEIRLLDDGKTWWMG